MLGPDNWVMYYFADGPEGAFIKKELMLIPKDTELPPDLLKSGHFLLSVKWSSQQK